MKKRTHILFYGKKEQREEKLARDPSTPKELSKMLLDNIRRKIGRKFYRV